MKFKTVLKKYPLMQIVFDSIIQMKKDGVPYPRLKEEWEKRAYELYPQEYKAIRFPSRTTLWQLSKEYDYIVCPLCNNKVLREETTESFLTDPQPHWERICKQCYVNRKIEYWKGKGHSPFLEDYILIKKSNYASGNPRVE
jgi:DNA-directed RNA polymerase subunit RPC12/RpoP